MMPSYERARPKWKKKSATRGRGLNKEATLPWEGRAVNTPVWIGENAAGIMRAYAEANQRSFSAVMREAVREYLLARGANIIM